MDSGHKSKLYHKGQKWIFYVSLAADIIVLLFFFLSGLSVQLRHWAAGFSSAAWGIQAVYLSIFCLFFYFLHLPLNYFIGHVWEHRFNLSNQKLLAWFVDDLKKGAISFIIILVFVEVLYCVLAKFPAQWWIGAGLVWLFLSLFLARIMPNVIIPLFYKYSVIADEELKKRIFTLFEKCRVRLKDVYGINFSAKTKKANAFVCGLGSQRRVVLGDTLLANFTTPEIEAVLAHELGHYTARDILKLIVVNTLLIFCGFYLIDKILIIVLSKAGGLSIADIAGFPVFALALTGFGFLTAPLLNAYSRFLETRADLFSLKLTANPESFISMMRKLGEMNLAEFEPSRFDEIMFYDHPPIAKRIRLAEKFK